MPRRLGEQPKERIESVLEEKVFEERQIAAVVRIDDARVDDVDGDAGVLVSTRRLERRHREGGFRGRVRSARFVT